MSLQKPNEIHITSNYKKEFDHKRYVEYANGYVELIQQFLLYTKENVLIQNNAYFFFIIKRGLETIGHIFKFLMMYTKNFNLTMHHCKKSFFYYIEFIGQIGDDNHTYLQLSSKDAMLFVFKKTIFEINNKHRQNFSLTEPAEIELLEFFLQFIMILNKLLFYCLGSKIMTGDKIHAIEYCIDSPMKIIKSIYAKKTSIHQTIENIKIIMFLFETLKLKDIKFDSVIIILKIFCKKIKKKKVSISHVKNKVTDITFDKICLLYTPLRIVNYIMST